MNRHPPTSRTSAVRPDFRPLAASAFAGANKDQPLYKALGLKKRTGPKPVVLDATCGMGKDTWLIAHTGCAVIAVERSPQVYALLREALDAALATDVQAAHAITLLHADAITLLNGIAHGEETLPPPGVVFIDPMFPDVNTRKTAPKKELLFLREVVGDDPDREELFAAAHAAATHRVVVKLPAKAKPLRGTPTVSHGGRGMRYDVYVKKAL